MASRLWSNHGSGWILITVWLVTAGLTVPATGGGVLFADMAAVKIAAERGDAAAQTELGKNLAGHFHPSEALRWFRQSTSQGNVEGEYYLGKLLLFGATGIPDSYTVKPLPSEGMAWTYRAATNHYPGAFWNMAKATSKGLGTTTNLVAAYAWLTLYSETAEGSLLGMMERNELVLKMDTAALEQGNGLAERYREGKFYQPVTQVIRENDAALKLNGLFISNAKPVAMINGKSLAEGESAAIRLKSGLITVRCEKIGTDWVQIRLEGEDVSRVLRKRCAN